MATSPPAPAQVASTPCIEAAAHHHRVHVGLLLAILRTESGLNPLAWRRNANGSLDLGLGQINSVHWPELALHGIAPQALLQQCIASYVAAWHLARQQAVYGNTWYAVGAYHSRTPRLNAAYQWRVWRQWQAQLRAQAAAPNATSLGAAVATTHATTRGTTNTLAPASLNRPSAPTPSRP